MNILVTGHEGFIGKHLVSGLKGKYILYTPTREELDLLDFKAVSKYIKDNYIDVVIHLASIGGLREEEDPSYALNNNLRMFLNLESSGVDKMIYMGSGAEYDKRQPLVDVDEFDSLYSIPKDDYGLYKYICARIADGRSSVINLRLFGVYGEGENDSRFITYAVKQSLKKEPIIIKKNVCFSYLYVKDLVKVVEHFINENGDLSIYNVVPDESYWLTEIVEAINEITGHHPKVKFESTEIAPHYTGSNMRLKEEMDIKFTPLGEGIKHLINYYKHEIS